MARLTIRSSLSLDNDYVWGKARNIGDVPAVFIERLQHYFLTYKLVPGERAKVRIAPNLWPQSRAASGARGDG